MKFVKNNDKILFYNEKSEQKLKEILSYLSLNNKYFKKKLSNVDYINKNIGEYYFSLPESDKDTIKENNGEYFSKSNRKVIHEITSGSSGKPFTCYKTVLERTKYANILWDRRKKIDDLINPNNFMSVFGKINIHQNIDFTVTTDENMNRIIEYIKSKKIRWISGSPSILLAYAQFINKKNETLHDVKYIELQGEGVDEYERKVIEKAFMAKTILHYGMREVWTIAYECNNNRMHFLDNNFLFEQDIKTGELFVTSLVSKYMPFIRYATGDKVEVQRLQKCDCGICDSYIMKVHNGRKANDIYGHNGKIGDIVFKRVIHRVICKFEKNDNIIRRYLVEQTNKNKFVIYIDRGKDYDLMIEKLITERVKEYLGMECEVVFRYEKIETNNGGKLSIFRKNIKY